MRAICEGQLKDKNRAKDLMLMLGLYEAIDQLATTNSVHWYGHMSRREDVCVNASLIFLSCFERSIGT